MQIHFLCPTHREWVYFNPIEALSKLDETQSTGETLAVQELWEDAIKYIGCAYETTEILIEIYGASSNGLLPRLKLLGSLLSNLSNRLYSQQQQATIQQHINQTLEKYQLRDWATFPQQHKVMARSSAAEQNRVLH